jgi:hypothetical protein
MLTFPLCRGHYLICSHIILILNSVISLTAMSVHFESQCIPTSLAWYAHHLPRWLLKLATVFTFIIEIELPLLFFFPVRSVRIITFILQVCSIVLLLQQFAALMNVLNFCVIHAPS